MEVTATRSGPPTRAEVCAVALAECFRGDGEILANPIGTLPTIGGRLAKATFEPGWKWSESVKPIAKTDSCQAHHVGYILTGKLHVVTDDGGEAELGPGEAYEVEPGHDAWVVGDEAVTSVEFSGAETYAKTS